MIRIYIRTLYLLNTDLSHVSLCPLPLPLPLCPSPSAILTEQSLKDLQRQLAEADARAGLSEREREAAEGRGQRLEQECMAVKEELQRVMREVEQGEEAVAAKDRWASIAVGTGVCWVAEETPGLVLHHTTVSPSPPLPQETGQPSAHSPGGAERAQDQVGLTTPVLCADYRGFVHCCHVPWGLDHHLEGLTVSLPLPLASQPRPAVQPAGPREGAVWPGAGGAEGQDGGPAANDGAAAGSAGSQGEPCPQGWGSGTWAECGCVLVLQSV